MTRTHPIIKNNHSYSQIILVVVCILSIMITNYMFLISTSTTVNAESGRSGPITIRSPRPPNTDSNGNDDFSSASIIEYMESGTTHIFSAGVGSTFDVCDFWRLDVDNCTDSYTGGKLVGTIDPDRLMIILSLNGTSSPGNGPWMEVYDAEKHKIAYTQVATETNPAIFDIVTQVNPYLYLKIMANPGSNNFKYILTIINFTEPVNPKFSNDEIFDYARFVNLTKGKTITNQDLTYIAQGLMDAVESLTDYHSDLFLDEVSISLSDTDHRVLEDGVMLRAVVDENGKGRWEFFGPVWVPPEEE